MARGQAYHDNSPENSPEHNKFYHDHDDCPEGGRIEKGHRGEGDGGKPLCKACQNLASLEEAREAWTVAAKSGDSQKLNAAGAAWLSAAQAEKVELETTRLRRSRGDVPSWVPVLTTLVSTAALVATLVFQIITAHENAIEQRNAEEDSDYRAALTAIGERDPIKGAVQGIPLIKAFLTSPRLGDQAREVAAGYVPGLVSVSLFRSLFDPLVRTTTWDNFHDLVEIDGNLNQAWHFYDDKIAEAEKEQTQAEAPPQPQVGAPQNTGATPATMPFFPPSFRARGAVIETPDGPIPLGDAKGIRDQVDSEVGLAEDALISFLRRSDEPEHHDADLSDAYFGYRDLSSLDLSRSNLTSASFFQDNVAGTDFSGVSSFDGSRWDDVGWWRASSISADLLKYLKQYYPYDSKTHYAEIETKTEYANDLKRLGNGV